MDGELYIQGGCWGFLWGVGCRRYIRYPFYNTYLMGEHALSTKSSVIYYFLSIIVVTTINVSMNDVMH